MHDDIHDHNPEPTGGWHEYQAARFRLFNRLAEQSDEHRRRLALEQCRALARETLPEREGSRE